MYEHYPNCDSLWLPPCPKCSQVAFWQRPGQDRLEIPGFRLARLTSASKGIDYWFLFGCEHACAISGWPIPNRLRLAVRWRRAAAQLLDALFRTGFTEEQRLILVQRLSHRDYSQD